MELQTECVLVCKVCGSYAYTVYRKPIGTIGGYEHVRHPEPEAEYKYKCKTCGGELKRK